MPGSMLEGFQSGDENSRVGEFHPLSMQQEEPRSMKPIRAFADEEEVLVRNGSPFSPVSKWSESSRQYFQKRYLCFWVLSALVPFILLRLTIFHDDTVLLFRLPRASSPTSPESAEQPLLPSRSSTNSSSSVFGSREALAPGPGVSKTITAGDRDTDADANAEAHRQDMITQEGSQIRPDEDAWRTHDEWITHAEGPPHKTKSKEEGKTDGEGTAKWAGPQENFGVPEDNDKQELPDWMVAELSKQNQKNDSVEKEASSEDGDGRQIDVRSSPQGVHEKYSASGDNNSTAEKEEGGTVPSKTMENITTSNNAGGLCDLFDGDWVPNAEEPLYTNLSCSQIQGHQNCMRNGRPDRDYLYWKWKPRECELPRFNASSFLDKFKGKSIGFVGDSLARNQMQSLLCMLSQVETPVETYQSEDDRTVRWLYKEHQVTVGAVWSPYLLKEAHDGVLGFEKGESVLYLDVLDEEWTSVLSDFDMVLLSTGQWFFKGSIYVKQNKVVGCHYCPGHNFTDYGFYDAYRTAMRVVLEKVVADFKGVAVMSTFAISHFEGGEWDSGGTCRRQQPLNASEGLQFPGPHNDMHDIVMSEYLRIAGDKERMKRAAAADMHLEFLDVTKLSLRRADGHPGPYRVPFPYEGKDPAQWVQNDCLHWCLPGPADTWNQLLVELLDRHL